MRSSGLGAVREGPEIVGREPERERIDAFLADVPNGARALLLRGEPGIGKTVLWRWATERALQLGYRVVVSRPAEEEMVIPLAALADLLHDADGVSSAIAPDSDQLTRGRAVLEALREFAEPGPVIVAIDDLQWLDSASARALRFGLRRLDSEPVGLLGSTRDARESEDQGLTATLLPGRVAAVPIGPLPIESMRALLGSAVKTISRPMLRRIHEMSGGNPFYAIELASCLVAGGDPVRDAPVLPASLGAAVAGRLQHLPGDLTRLLEAVAVLGRATVVTLASLLPELDVDAELTRARLHGLLAVEDHSEVRFSHALLASAVYERMSRSQRIAWHGAVAVVASDPDVRAWHVALSTDTPDEVVAKFIEEAIDRASNRGAPDIAAKLAAHSVRLTPPRLTEALHRRTLAQVEHLAAAGEVGRAQSVVDALITTMAAGPARAEALVRRWELDDDDPAASEAGLRQALNEAGGDDRLRIRILTALGRGRDHVGDIRGALELCREALDIAERVGDATMEMSAATVLAYVETKAGVPRFDLMERAVRLENDLPMPVFNQSPSELMVLLMLWQGELTEARRLLALTHTRAMKAGLEWKSLQHDYGVALLECMAGNLHLADEAVRRATTAAQDAEDPWSERVLLYPHGLIAAWLGDLESARIAAEQLTQDPRGLRFTTANGRRVLGLLALSGGDWRTAAVELGQASALSDESGIGHPGVGRELPDVVEAVAFSGDLIAAQAHLDRLDGQAKAVAGPWPEAAAVRARGALLLASGEGDQAAELLGEATARFDQLGFAPDAARSRLLQGRALGRAGHRSRAAQALADAHHRFATIGAAVWEQKAADELERVAPGHAAGILTQTESRIAALIADGLRNREIGEALFMSVATVEAHLTRIYRKLDIRSRTELSRLVASGDLALSGTDESP